MSNRYSVEGRYFPNTLYAFTFAQIQADRMMRPVEVHFGITGREHCQGRKEKATWHATAHPSNFARRHLVTV
jgi:hypothetical protein